MFRFFFLVPGTHWQTYKKPGIVGAGGIRKVKPAPKPQQLLYCDVCKISCGGPQVQNYKTELPIFIRFFGLNVTSLCFYFFPSDLS